MRIKNILSKYAAYFVGISVWTIAVISLVFIVKSRGALNRCPRCTAYSRFVDGLDSKQKSKIDMLEAGVIDIRGAYYYIGEGDSNEYELRKKDIIFYEIFHPNVDEQTKRLYDINTIIKSLPPSYRELVIARKAALIYRNGGYEMIGEKAAYELAKNSTIKGEQHE